MTKRLEKEEIGEEEEDYEDEDDVDGDEEEEDDYDDDDDDDDEEEEADATEIAKAKASAIEFVDPPSEPSMSLALFIHWVFPVLIIAIFSRFGSDLELPRIPIEPSRPVQIDVGQSKNHHHRRQTTPSRSPTTAEMTNMIDDDNNDRAKKPSDRKKKKKKQTGAPTSAPYALPADIGPTAYRETVKEINRRNRKWQPETSLGTSSPSSSPTPPSTSGGSQQRGSDSNRPTPPSPTRHKRKMTTSTSNNGDTPPGRTGRPGIDRSKQQLEEKLEEKRAAYEADPDNVLKALDLADTLRMMDLQFHDGGSKQMEAIDAYQHAILLTLDKREGLIERGEPTDMSLSGTRDVSGEVMFTDYSQKSVDGLLCSMFTSMGKTYFMANMFERAVDSYNKCIELEPMYLDAVGSRGSSLIILGKYEEAGRDFQRVLENDHARLFNDAFTGMAKVLAAKEEVVPKGWGPTVTIIEDLIPKLERNIEMARNQGADPSTVRMMADSITRLYHVMFQYHDVKTKDVDEAWRHLQTGYKHKLSVLPPFNAAYERQKVTTTKQVFHLGFWPARVGSPSDVPIFIIGFVRSGSTLLERVLDAHPAIVGTGEDSVFNGRLDRIRNSIVDASMSGHPRDLERTVRERAEEVVDDMRMRYEIIEANTGRRNDTGHVEPKRFADKMLTNYFNVGFIHMLFPKALILHVARNPMDTIFSAYKHEFPPGGLDYTSEFKGLAAMYSSYREVMSHWDAVLPGRVTHVRYEDMVKDMPGMARAIIDATGLDWNDSVLDFHKKKHAVNTLSTTQVRKGIYKDSLEAWKRYETQLRPLKKLVGDLSRWDLKTTLETYVPTQEG